MQILDLRRVRSSQLEELLQEEQRIWLEQLHWDYGPSAQLIARFIDSQSLSGFAALEQGRGIGYSFFVPEEHKALIGDLFVTAARAGTRIERELAAQVIEAMRTLPGLRRIEAQLIPFGPDSLRDCFARESFEIHSRLFMHVPLEEVRLEMEKKAPVTLRRWDDRDFEATAVAIVSSYAGHVDARINDQYQSVAGALKFLKNIIIFPGCGVFQPDTSFVALDGRGQLVGLVLGSMVAHRVGHITQICVLPEHQRQGLGGQLLAAALGAFGRKRYTAVSLTVTESNAHAVRLYERFGFRTAKRFDAFLWEAAPRGTTSGPAL